MLGSSRFEPFAATLTSETLVFGRAAGFEGEVRLKARRKVSHEEPYERGARDERRARYRDALRALRDFVRAKCHVGGEVFGHPFGHLLTTWIEDAVVRVLGNEYRSRTPRSVAS